MAGAVTGLLLSRRSPLASPPKSRRAERRSGYDFMTPRQPGHAGRRHRQSRHAVRCSTARRCGSARPAPPAKPAPTVIDDAAHQHEGRRGPLSGLRQRRSAGRSIWSSASNRAATMHQQARRLPVESQRTAGADRLSSRCSRVAQPIAPPDDPQTRRRSATTAARCSASARASSILACANATTTTGTSPCRQRRSRRPIRPAIRSTGWNGRSSARCSGGCATA